MTLVLKYLKLELMSLFDGVISSNSVMIFPLAFLLHSPCFPLAWSQGWLLLETPDSAIASHPQQPSIS